MRLTQRVLDGFQGRPYRAKIRAIQRAVGADDRKSKADAKRARRAARRAGRAS
jgi:hypothetical protein